MYVFHLFLLRFIGLCACLRLCDDVIYVCLFVWTCDNLVKTRFIVNFQMFKLWTLQIIHSNASFDYTLKMRKKLIDFICGDSHFCLLWFEIEKRRFTFRLPRSIWNCSLMKDAAMTKTICFVSFSLILFLCSQRFFCRSVVFILLRNRSKLLLPFSADFETLNLFNSTQYWWWWWWWNSEICNENKNYNK